MRPIVGDGAGDARHITKAHVIFQTRFHAKRHPTGEKREEGDGDCDQERGTTSRPALPTPAEGPIAAGSGGRVEHNQQDQDNQRCEA